MVTTINYIMKKHHNQQKGQRNDRLKQKRIFQTSWKEKIPWVEAIVTTILGVCAPLITGGSYGTKHTW
jgi:hypothetical protein